MASFNTRIASACSRKYWVSPVSRSMPGVGALAFLYALGAQPNSSSNMRIMYRVSEKPLSRLMSSRLRLVPRISARACSKRRFFKYS